MTVDERTRRDLYAAFEESWGAERTEAMMHLLPPVGWGDVATRRDLDAVRTCLQHELRTGLVTLDTRITTEVAGLRTEMAELRTEFHRDLASATRTMAFSLTSSVFVVGSLAFAAASLV